MERKRIYFSDWLDRVDMYLCIAIGKRTGSMQGILWEKLYNAGISPGDAVDAVCEEYCAVLKEEQRMQVNG
jgi:hypothetical protein